MSAFDHTPAHTPAAGILLLCRAAPDRVRPAAQLLRRPLLMAPAGEEWSVLVPAEKSWLDNGTNLAAVTADWAHALTVDGNWPVVGLWWDADGAGFVVAAGFRRTVGHTWLADGTPLGGQEAMTALRARLGLDPVLDAAAFDRLIQQDGGEDAADASARVLGLVAVLARAGLHLGPGLVPGVSAGRLCEAAGALPGAEPVDWPGWRAVERGALGVWTRGPRARALGTAEVALGAALLVWSRGSERRGWRAAGVALVADGALTLLYDRWRAGRA